MARLSVSRSLRFAADSLFDVRTHERKAPVVLMSSFGGERAAVEAREAGAADFVCRPFPPSELVRKLDRAIDTREAA